MTKQFKNNLVENINFGFIVNMRHNNCACIECTPAVKKITPKKHRHLEKGVNDLATLYPDIVVEWNYEFNKKGPDEYTCGSNQKVYFTCSTCGYGSNGEWMAKICERTKGRGCPACAGKAVYKGVNDLATLRPDIAAEWNYEFNEKGPDEYTCGMTVKVHFICSTCNYGSNGEWMATINHRTSGYGCPACAGKAVYKGVNDLATLRPDIAAEWNYEFNKKGPDEYTCGSNKKVYFTCSTCGYGSNGEWMAIINNRTKGRDCPKCSSSKGEKIIAQILKVHNIDFKKEFTFNDCIYEGPLRFDFAIFNSKGELVKLVEYDGLQHFKPVNFGGMSDERALEEHKLTKKRDKIKNTYCKKNNISLLRIKYTEFSNLEEIITNLLKELKLI